jgi:hypothetical protein
MAYSLEQLQAAYNNAIQSGDEEAAQMIQMQLEAMQQTDMPSEIDLQQAPAMQSVDTGAMSNQQARRARQQNNVANATYGNGGSIADPLGQGATFGFADEIVGLLGATYGTLMPESAGGFPEDFSFWDAYDGITAAARGQLNNYQAANPKTALAAEIGAGIVTGGMGMARGINTLSNRAVRKGLEGANTAGQNLAAGALVGGAEGALAGAGYADEGGRLEGAAMGAAIGAPVGLLSGAVINKFIKSKADKQTLINELSNTVDRQNADTVGKMIQDLSQTGTNPKDIAILAESATEEAKRAAGTQKIEYANFIETLRKKQANVIEDKLELAAQYQGWDDAFLTSLRGVNPLDRNKMIQMLMRQKRARTNRFLKLTERPEAIAGDSLAAQVDQIIDMKAQAGENVNEAVKKLRERPDNMPLAAGTTPSETPYSQLLNNIDISINDFMNDLDEMGIKIEKDANGNFVFNDAGELNVNFTGSDIEGLTDRENVIMRMLSRMSKTDPLDLPIEAHRLKKYIDENVSYGTDVRGLTGITQNKLKKLRLGLNKALQDYSPEYKAANEMYADTITALDKLQAATPLKLDIFDDKKGAALGTEMRKFFSNYASREALHNAVLGVAGTVKKYGGVADDNLVQQAMFFDELKAMYGTPATNSFEGASARATQQGMQAAQYAISPETGAFDAAAKGAAGLFKKLKGIDEEKSIEAMHELLKRGRN